ncbi:UvrD-helicase domain-containing protein [Listeria booriae]|uniref:UvrD-helicase domain-containing protein n=1 Tax=Listeria booriae TaxID=1552123 RepID=UPI001C8A11C7|nr:UvrD-helicase domain-containing protein [Listeria booriae]
MSQLKIDAAGAGAGKTTKLAEKIIERYRQGKEENIYCVSFTNASVSIIVEKLKEYYYEIPENIKVSTIHSFLNSELIAPYHFLLYKKQFHSISNVELSHVPKYKTSQISRLERRGCLHVDAFTKKAKYVVCEKSGDKKQQKIDREKICSLISSYMGVIYVDEAQDIDTEFKQVLIKLDELGIDIELIGDPKQDLKGRGGLVNLITEYQADVRYIQECYRCPVEHLNFSNKYVLEREQQFSPENKTGILQCIFESDLIDIGIFINEKNYDLKYIYQKDEQFDTHFKLSKDPLFNELRIIISDYEDGSIDDISTIRQASKLAYELISLVTEYNYTQKAAISKKIPFGSIQKDEYARLLEALESETNEVDGNKITVRSIEAIKGLEEEKCLFIVTPEIAPYLLKLKTDMNKMMASLYVALTRSQKELDILVTRKVEEQFGREVFETILNATI